MKILDITSCLEKFAPLSLQESFDNSGLIIGNNQNETEGVLICLDISAAVIEEAKLQNCKLIISHHPPLFHPIKRINSFTLAEKNIVSLIKNDIAVYSAHTNIDNVFGGINSILANILKLKCIRFLNPQKSFLRKLVFFCPISSATEVRAAVFAAGAGNIGNYDECSFNIEGKGSFRANEKANPYVGSKNKLHFEPEIRIETVFPIFMQKQIISSLLNAHPYEEVAYDIYSLENDYPLAGVGIIGELAEEMPVHEFLLLVKDVFSLKHLRYCIGKNTPVKKIAVCGGAGSFLIQNAISQGADTFITSDIKYHDFQTAEGYLTMIDAGHFETEVCVKEILKTVLSENFPNFAVHTSKTESNPVKYL